MTESLPPYLHELNLAVDTCRATTTRGQLPSTTFEQVGQCTHATFSMTRFQNISLHFEIEGTSSSPDGSVEKALGMLEEHVSALKAELAASSNPNTHSIKRMIRLSVSTPSRLVSAPPLTE